MTIEHFASYTYQKDTAGNRPASVSPSDGKLYIFEASDTGDISIWNNSSSEWIELNNDLSVFAYLASDDTGKTDNTWSAVGFDTESWDDGGYFDTTSNGWTPPAGKYRISVQVTMAASGDGINAQCRLLRDASIDVTGPVAFFGGSASVLVAVLNVLVEADGAEEFTVECRSNTGGGNYDINGGADATFFNAERL